MQHGGFSAIAHLPLWVFIIADADWRSVILSLISCLGAGRPGAVVRRVSSGAAPHSASANMHGSDPFARPSPSHASHFFRGRSFGCQVRQCCKVIVYGENSLFFMLDYMNFFTDWDACCLLEGGKNENSSCHLAEVPDHSLPFPFPPFFCQPKLRDFYECHRPWPLSLATVIKKWDLSKNGTSTCVTKTTTHTKNSKMAEPRPYDPPPWLYYECGNS